MLGAPDNPVGVLFDPDVPVARLRGGEAEEAPAQPAGEPSPVPAAHGIDLRLPVRRSLVAGGCWMIAGGEYQVRPSPDRADAMVWALTELMLRKERGEPSIRRL